MCLHIGGVIRVKSGSIGLFNNSEVLEVTVNTDSIVVGYIDVVEGLCQSIIFIDLRRSGKEGNSGGVPLAIADKLLYLSSTALRPAVPSAALPESLSP